MSEALKTIYRREGSWGVLRAFGLDHILTGQDDPDFWAAALVRHWYAPGEAELQPDALRFGVSRPVPEGDVGDVNVGKSGMEPLEEWCFEPADADTLLAVVCKEQPALSFMGMLMSGEPVPVSSAGTWVRDYLEVSRPSLGESKAFVHSGMSAPLGAGNGETRAWERTADGVWLETGEVLARWLS